MKKISLFTAVSYIAAAAWMAVIFAYSAQDAVRSLQSSDGVMNYLLSAFGSLFEHFSRETLSFVVRKCAHFGVFFVLGVLVTNAVARSGGELFYIGSLGLDICVFYAASDEFHQYFIDGRACRLFDICVDSVGALLGVLLTCLIIRLCRRRAARGKAEAAVAA